MPLTDVLMPMAWMAWISRRPPPHEEKEPVMIHHVLFSVVTIAVTWFLKCDSSWLGKCCERWGIKPGSYSLLSKYRDQFLVRFLWGESLKLLSISNCLIIPKSHQIHGEKSDWWATTASVPFKVALIVSALHSWCLWYSKILTRYYPIIQSCNFLCFSYLLCS